MRSEGEIVYEKHLDLIGGAKVTEKYGIMTTYGSKAVCVIDMDDESIIAEFKSKNAYTDAINYACDLNKRYEEEMEKKKPYYIVENHLSPTTHIRSKFEKYTIVSCYGENAKVNAQMICDLLNSKEVERDGK